MSELITGGIGFYLNAFYDQLIKMNAVKNIIMTIKYLKKDPRQSHNSGIKTRKIVQDI